MFILSGIVLEGNLLSMNESSDSQSIEQNFASTGNKRRREDSSIQENEPYLWCNEIIKHVGQTEAAIGDAPESSVFYGAIENSEKPILRQGFKFNLFKAQECPILLRQVLSLVEGDPQSSEILTTQWQYSGGSYYFKAYHSGVFGLSGSFLQGEKPSDLMLKTLYKWSMQHVNDLDLLEDLLDSQLEKIGFKKEATEDAQAACRRMLASHYKIHLMPQPGQLQNILETLMRAFIDNQELRLLVSEFKVSRKFVELASRESVSHEQALAALAQDDYYMPALIIYPQNGKEHAQRVLDIIEELFDGVQGLDVVPRFNQKVTSLIYYAQGNGDDKIYDHLKSYYEDDLIHFKSDFTGRKVDYRLTFFPL